MGAPEVLILLVLVGMPALAVWWVVALARGGRR